MDGALVREHLAACTADGTVGSGSSRRWVGWARVQAASVEWTARWAREQLASGRVGWTARWSAWGGERA
ncbi:hypothetical protein, partial [Actinoplanes regularis]|uniref:hypothetical protein n=1 Tax=Actinoplanes regularis TaxID=52697 RepID=UPI0019450432